MAAPTVWRALGPAMARIRLRDAGLAALGAGLGLAACAWLILAPEVDLRHGLYMIAPLGASAVLLFAAPNSPLAQPWSAVVGNSVSATATAAETELPTTADQGCASGLLGAAKSSTAEAPSGAIM